jgi:hypothetical protein
LHPATVVEQTRYDLTVELLSDIRRLDAQLADPHRRIRLAIRASAHLSVAHGMEEASEEVSPGWGDRQKTCQRDDGCHRCTNLLRRRGLV